jgi:acetyl/propionyl-CoA carboxylase alpha subunit
MTDQPIQTVFIANRGEIALRIIQTVHKMGMRAVGVYIEQEKQAPYVQHCDEVRRLSGFTLQSFLDMDDLLEHAKAMGAQAVHPGYGFLSENAVFAQRCEEEGLIWIGPSSEVIDTLGDKQKAKDIARACQVPVLESLAENQDNDPDFEQALKKMTLPILLKPMMGGGGKGMTVVRDVEQLSEALTQARSIAKNAFGDARLMAEPFLEKPRHIEVQMLRDQHGQTSFLWERDCTLQRRHQKIIEEAPSIFVTDVLRRQLARYATDLFHHVNYTNAGTVEFIVDHQDQVYFMEVNTRLQVEHPVTEQLLDIDLVQAQIQIAQNEKVSIHAQPSGHALEVRVYAENPDQDFMPSTGMVQHLTMPKAQDWLRLDMGIEEGTAVTSFFDPMLIKITVKGEDRPQAMDRMREALAQMRLAGVQTNQSYLDWALQHYDFRQGKHHTQWAAHTLSDYCAYRTQTLQNILPQWEQNFAQRYGSDSISAWQKARYIPSDHAKLWQFQHKSLPSHALNPSEAPLDVFHRHQQDWLFSGAQVFLLEQKNHESMQGQAEHAVISPMTGTITQVHVHNGDAVKKDQILVEMEAMKMQYQLRAPKDGKVSEVSCRQGQVVQGDTVLVDIQSL